ncbi:MAG: hypothetical protein PHG44_05880, partial [Lentisphaeria bacterium]|nr:hypothetical protein [Lentisphaeria bacterium]
SLGSYGASLTLGCIRLPLRGTKWTDSQGKIEISAENLRFSCYFIEFFWFVRLSFPNKPKRASGLCGACGAA